MDVSPPQFAWNGSSRYQFSPTSANISFISACPSLLLSRARGIELVEQIELFELLVEYRLLVRIIELASVHSFIPMVFLLFCFLRFDYTLCARFFSLF